jgi:Fic family protein
MLKATFIQRSEGYRVYVPGDLPMDPALQLEGELLTLLSEADQALARLDGAASVMPNPDLFVAMYVRHEAVLSSRIEGTQSTLEDVLTRELEEGEPPRHPDVDEVLNYVRAMDYGLERIGGLPLSLRLLRELHGRLMKGVRGDTANPGEFRRIPVSIGPKGATIQEATFVPPTPDLLQAALDNFEPFLHDRSLPVLVHSALAHAQFELIHPFLDGNGRLGRLLVTLLLGERGVLHRPLLYLSTFFETRRTEYYDRLNAVSTSGDWKGWLKFFLAGVREVSNSAAKSAREILHLRETHRQLVKGNANALRLLDHLFERPVITNGYVQKLLNVSFPTASGLVSKLEAHGLLQEVTGSKRNSLYRYEPYLSIFERRVT